MPLNFKQGHMKRTALLLIVFISLLNTTAQDLMNPGEYIGHKLGTEFTLHHQALDYFKYIAEESDNVSYLSYGKTYEGRELGVVFVSSTENINKLEQIRKDNLINTGLLEGESSGKQLPIVWLSYNVHGNESVGMEAALKTLHTLVSGSYKGVSDWLEECVIVIDPCQNPDGRDLYTMRYRKTQSVQPNASPDDWEHHQGWPSARLNHYLFDLNRDWSWQTQKETQLRLALYNKYMPHVHADFHEMGSGSTFFFAPGADPWHEVITPWQHKFHELTGKANAELFDETYKLYFTKESFDLFCPSFGDTWPLFNGAMGFTYEQGGGGYAGLALARETTGDTITLEQRIEGHYLASMATIKVSYENREKLVSEFNEFFKSGLTEPVCEYESVIIKGDNEASALAALMDLLDKNQIRYSLAGNKGKTYKGFDYLANKDREVEISEGDILVSARQPQAHLFKVFFEPDSKYTDSLNYDLTAWAMPYLFNVKAYAIKENIPSSGEMPEEAGISNKVPESKTYAYIADWQGFNELKFMADMLKEKIRVRSLIKPFTIDSSDFARGSLIIARGDNMNIDESFDKKVTELANKAGVKLFAVKSGMAEKGKDLGSNYAVLKYKPEIALIGGEGVSTGGFGELWFFMERELEYPVTVIRPDYLSSVDLDDYDVVLLPSGSYTKQKEQLKDYVKQGGRLALFENAIRLFASDESTNLYKAAEARKKEREKEEDKLKTDDPEHLKKFENKRRERLTERSSGSIYRISLDNSHPYAFGLGKEWFMMRRSSNHYPYLASGNNIGYILDSEPVAGFAGHEFREKVKNTIVIASESMGRGEVIYITDSPYYRAYWKSGRVLLGNILFR